MAPRDSLRVSVDGVAMPQPTGYTLPSLVEDRTFRSKPGGTISVKMVQDPAKALGTASLFSFRIPCTGDAACGGHGTCQEGACACDTIYFGHRCETHDLCLGVDCSGREGCASGDDSCATEINGVCVDGSCECKNGASGSRCELSRKAVVRRICRLTLP